MSYLYGMSVQGIQGFIFETNALKEIVGASELVEQLCTSRFNRATKEMTGIEFILQAAGNIRAIVQDKSVLQQIVREWPLEAESMVPGITLSQAVVAFDGELNKETMNRLEERLKVQRNRVSTQEFPALMAMERCRRTGRPAIDRKDKSSSGLRDRTMACKQKAGANNAPHSLMKKMLPESERVSVERIPFDMDDLTGKRESNWIAIIHADGNSLGKIIQGMSSKLDSAKRDKLKSAFQGFSTALDDATQDAARDAFSSVVLSKMDDPLRMEKKWKYPIRPVVLGGDDLTVICRADFAIKFTEEFLQAFQKRTAQHMKQLVTEFDLKSFENGLTACAGIAFVKQSYPFHYAIHLAEQLCGYAKKEAKAIDENNVPACLMFHKVQSSFVDDSYQTTIKRELTGIDGVSMACGPYYLEGGSSNQRTIRSLLEHAERLSEPDAPKSGLRQWLALLHEDLAKAEQFMERLKQIHKPYRNDLEAAVAGNKCPAYDWLSVASITEGA
jgi:hypothetical protein